MMPENTSIFHTPADFGYRRDNPGGDWLARKQRWAVEDAKGKHNGLAHFMAAGAQTAWMGTDKPMYIPVSVIKYLPGANDEQYYRKPGDVHFDSLQQSVQDTGWNQQYPIVIRVNHLGRAVIMEGNTRKTIALLHGVKDVRVAFQWMNGGEDAEDDLWSPKRVAEICLPRPRKFQPKAFWEPEMNEGLTDRLEQDIPPYEDDPDFSLKMPSSITVYRNAYAMINEEVGRGEYATPEEQDAFHDALMPGTRERYGRVMMLPHSQLVTGQSHVSGAGVEHYLENPGKPLMIYRFTLEGQRIDLVMDGNHRLVADVLSGKTESQCLVLDLDQWMDDQGEIYGSYHPAVISGAKPNILVSLGLRALVESAASLRRWIDLVCEGDIVSLGQHRWNKAAQNYADSLRDMVASERAFYANKFLPLATSFIESGFDPSFAPEFLIDVSFGGVENMTPEIRELGQSLRAKGFKNLHSARVNRNGKRVRDLPYFRKKISFEEARRYFEQQKDGYLGAYQPSALGYGERTNEVYDNRGIGFSITMGGQDSRRGKYGKPYHEAYHVIDNEADMAEVGEAMALIKRARFKSV